MYTSESLRMVYQPIVRNETVNAFSKDWEEAVRKQMNSFLER